jgi:hypothetical protein
MALTQRKSSFSDSGSSGMVTGGPHDSLRRGVILNEVKNPREIQPPSFHLFST